MVDLDEQEADISPRRRLAKALGSELIANCSMDYAVVVEGVAICHPEKDEVSHTTKKASQYERKPSYAPASLERGVNDEDQAENDHFFFDPKDPSGQQPSQKIYRMAVMALATQENLPA